MATAAAPAVDTPPAAPAPASQTTPAAVPPSATAAPEPAAPAATPAPAPEAPVAAPPAQGPMVNEEALSVLSALEGLDLDTVAIANELAEANEETPVPAAPAEPASAPDLKDKLPIGPAAEAAAKAKAEAEAPPAEPAPATPAAAAPAAPVAPGEPVVIEHPAFQGGKWDLGNNATQDIQFESVEQVQSFVKEKYGVDDLNKLFPSADKWRNDSQELTKANGEVAKYETLFNGLPSDLYEMFQRHTKGEDYKDVILGRPNLDFTKKENEQSGRDLVNAYFPDQFSKEDWEAYNDNEHDNHDSVKRVIDLAIPQAQKQYTTQQGEFDVTRATAIKAQDDLVLLKTTSADSSVEHLTKSVPELNTQYATSLRTELLGGGLQDLFLKEDGSFKEDALYRMMMAKDGPDIMEQMKGMLTNQIQTAERVEVLERTPAQPKSEPAPQGNQGEVREELRAHLDSLFSGLNESPAY